MGGLIYLHSGEVAQNALELLQIRLAVDHGLLLLVRAPQIPPRVVNLFACIEQRFLKGSTIARKLQELTL